MRLNKLQLSLVFKNATRVDDEIAAISKFANTAITIIWLAGIGSIMVYIFYFLFFLVNAVPAKSRTDNADKLPEANVFSDKTTLVNIGLKIEAVSANTDTKVTGSIRIHKIKHDEQINRTVRSVKSDFIVKPIPK